MPEGVQQAAPLAEPNPEDSPEPDPERPLSYDLWPSEHSDRPRGFDAGQIQQLYLQMNHHCQLMVEVYALTACNSEYQAAAVILANLLAEYQVGAPYLKVSKPHLVYACNRGGEEVHSCVRREGNASASVHKRFMIHSSSFAATVTRDARVGRHHLGVLCRDSIKLDVQALRALFVVYMGCPAVKHQVCV